MSHQDTLEVIIKESNDHAEAIGVIKGLQLAREQMANLRRTLDEAIWSRINQLQPKEQKKP